MKGEAALLKADTWAGLLSWGVTRQGFHAPSSLLALVAPLEGPPLSAWCISFLFPEWR